MAEHLQPGEGPAPVFRPQAFYDALEGPLGGLSAEDAVEAVLCALALRLPAGVVQGLERSLAPDLLQLMRTCPVHRRVDVLGLGAEEFYERVGAHVDVDAQEGERITRLVFRALQPYVEERVAREIARQLPRELGDAWSEARREHAPALR